MELKTYQVTIDGITKPFAAGTTYAEIIEDFDVKTKYPVVLVVSRGRLRELHKTLKMDTDVIPVTTQDRIGHKSYKRSMSLLLLKAVYRVAGRENIRRVILHYSVSDGFYFTVDGDVKIDQDFLDRVKAYMLEQVKKKLPIMKRSEDLETAVELFHKHGMYDKERLFRYRRISKVNIYSLGDFEDYFYGFMVHHTGYLKYFELYPYDEGFVLQLPKQSQPDVVAPFKPSPKIFQVQKEAEKWGRMLEVDTVGAMNDLVSKSGLKQMILISEALQEGKISKIAEEIAAQRNTKFIMIAGPSSSGKTTFSHRLSIQLAAHGLKPHPIAVDNYFVNREDTPLDEHGERNYECLGAVDVEQFNQDMTALLNGERVEIPRYNFVLGKREYNGNYLQLGPEDVLVIEGIHGLNDQLSHSLPRENKYKIYISALTQLNIDEHNRIPTTDGRLIRRMVRDNRTRGTSAKDTIAMWGSVRRGEEENIFPYQEEADVMFNSALIYELAVLKNYAEPILFQIEKGSPEYYEATRLLKFLDYFVGVPSNDVPNNSILREFVGGGCFDL